jgi:hypothetical protein
LYNTRAKAPNHDVTSVRDLKPSTKLTVLLPITLTCKGGVHVVFLLVVCLAMNAGWVIISEFLLDGLIDVAQVSGSCENPFELTHLIASSD